MARKLNPSGGDGPGADRPSAAMPVARRTAWGRALRELLPGNTHAPGGLVLREDVNSAVPRNPSRRKANGSGAGALMASSPPDRRRRVKLADADGNDRLSGHATRSPLAP